MRKRTFLTALALLAAPAMMSAAVVTLHNSAAPTSAGTSGALGSNEFGVGNSQVYTGGGASFGGAVGAGSLYIGSNGTNLDIGFQPGADFGSNVGVLYLDTKAGGFNDSGMSDTSDGGRNAVTNLASGGEDTLPFLADYAVLYGSWGQVLFELTAGTLNVVTTTNNTGSGTAFRRVTVPLATLGSGPGRTIDSFMVQLSETNFVSNETIPAIPAFNSAGQPGFNPSVWADNNRFVPYVSHLTPIWSHVPTAAPGNTYLTTSGTNRTLTYNAATGNLILSNAVATAAGTAIKRVRAEDGTILSDLDKTGLVDNATFSVVKFRASNGRIFAGGFTTDNRSATANNVFRIYYWANESAAPVTIYFNNAAGNTAPGGAIGPQMPSNTTTSFRLGDTFDVVGDGAGNFEIYTLVAVQASAGPATRVFRFNFSDASSAVSSIDDITLTGSATGNTAVASGYVSVDGFGGTIFRASGVEHAKYDNVVGTGSAAGRLLANANLFGGTAVTSVGGKIGTLGSEKLLGLIDSTDLGVGLQSRTYNRVGVAVVNPANGGGIEKATLIYTTPTPSVLFTNGNGTGDVDFDTARGRVFTLLSNNIVASYRLPVASPTQPKRFTNGGGDFQWNNPANWTDNAIPNGRDNVVIDNTTISSGSAVLLHGPQTQNVRTLTVGNAAAGSDTVRLQVGGTGNTLNPIAVFIGTGANGVSVNPTSSFTYPTAATSPLNSTKAANRVNPNWVVSVVSGGTNPTIAWNNGGFLPVSTITTRALTSNVATITVNAAHNYAVGDTVTVALSPPNAVFDGTYTISAVAATTFSYARTNANVTSAATGGTATISSPGSIARFDYGEQVAVVPPATIDIGQGMKVDIAAGTYVAGDNWRLSNNNSRMTLVVSGDQTDASADLIVRNGGTFEAASGATGGNFMNIRGGNNIASFQSGGTFLQRHALSFGNVFQIPGTGVNGGTEFQTGSTAVYDCYEAVNIPATSGRTFHNLRVTNSYGGGSVSPNTGLGGASPLTINGDLTVDPGVTFEVTSGAGVTTIGGNIISNGNAAINLTKAGVPTVFAGNTTISGSQGVLLNAGLTVNAGSSLTLSSLGLTVPAANPVNVNGTLSVPTGAVLTANGNITLGAAGEIAGAGGVTTAAATVVSSANPAGVTINTSGTNTINAATGFVLNGTAAQVTAGLPATVAALTINNAAGVTLSAPVAATALTLTAGELITGANALTAGTVARTTGFVVGTLTRSIDGTVTGARAFPVGTAGAYAPVSVDITAAGTGTGTIAVSSTASTAAGLPAAGAGIARFWDVDATGISGATYTLGFTYLDADLGSLDENALVAYRNGGTWAAAGSTTITAASNLATVTGVTALSPWTLLVPSSVPGVSSSSIAFGTVNVGNNSDLTFDLTNVGGLSAYDVSAFNITGTGFSVISPASFPVTVNPGGTVTVTVRFAPATAVAFSETLTVDTNAATDPTVTLTGTGATGFADWTLIEE